MKRVCAVFLVLAMMFTLVACSDQSETTKDTGVLDVKALTDKLNELYDENGIAGMAVAVTDGKQMIYNEGFGYDNVNLPNIHGSADSIFRIASISKTFTAIMVMRLYEKGILDLDTPIKTYLPWLTLSEKEAAETMTLRHLLIHTAGMPADDYMHPGSHLDSTINDTIKMTLPSLEISSLPSEGIYQYSTWGYNLIGCVASTVTGKTLSELISEHVLEPLDMKYTTFDYAVASTSSKPLSLPHVRSGNELRVDKLLINSAFNAGGGLYSNTIDMSKLARFFINGGVTDSGKRLLSEKTFKEMTTMHIDRGDGTYYGFGVSFRKLVDRYIYGHAGTYYGQNYYSTFLVDEKTGYGVTTLMNTRSLDLNLRYTIPEMIFEMLDKK